MVKDLTPKKKSQKELIVAAIELLKAKGFDINPFTVADEAGIPRSVLYRNTEFMELVKQAKGEGADEEQPINGSGERVAELEDRCKVLEEQLWNMEAQNEALAKEKQDAWNAGFQAGLEEAAKRQAEATPAQADFTPALQPTPEPEPASPPPPPPPPPPPKPEPAPKPAAPQPAAEVPKPAAPEPVAEAPAPVASTPVASTPVAPAPEPVAPAPGPVAAAPKPAPQVSSRSDTIDISKPDTKQLDLRAAAEPQQNFAAPSQTADNHTQPTSKIYPDEIKNGMFNAARSGPYTGSNFNPLVELSWRDVETVYNYSSSTLKDLAQQIPEGAPVKKEAPPQELLGADWQDPASASNFAPAPAAPAQQQTPAQASEIPPPSTEAQSAYREYAYNTNYSIADANNEGVLPPTGESLFPSEESLTQFEPVPEPATQESVATQQQSYQNVAAQQQSYQNVAAQQQSYQNAPAQQAFADQAPGYTDPQQEFSESHYTDVNPFQKLEKKKAPSYMAEGFFDHADESYVGTDGGQMPQDVQARTGDRLQAISDPRDFSGSTPVVDLDSLDIFDDIDDYVDINKIEVIDDVQIEPGQDEEAQKTAGDELRELIKGRIKQADAQQHDPAGRSMAGGAPVGEKAGGGARNKFVGGKSQPGGPTQESTVPPPPPPTGAFLPKLTPEMRRHCMILGVSPEPDQLTKEKVMQAWKNQIAAPGVHPDHGGDTETAVALNTAKDQLIRWLDTNGPKLGKKFGGGGKPGPGPQPGAQ